MTALSLVVANILRDPGSAAPSLASLERELTGDDQVVWVDAAGLADQVRGPDLTRIEAPTNSSRGDLYRRGLDVSRSAVVAFTDSSTELLPGWRTAVVDALGARGTVVGGPVLPGPARSPLTTSGFLVEYGVHAAPPFTNAGGDVAANNVAYDRALLEWVLGPSEPVWKSAVNQRLASRGTPPRLVPAMQVRSTKRYGWHDLVPSRLAHGRLYGAQRAKSWSAARRAVAAGACPLLPPLAFARLASRLTGHPGLRRSLFRCMPLVLTALAAWSAGEALGYLYGEAGATDVF